MSLECAQFKPEKGTGRGYFLGPIAERPQNQWNALELPFSPKCPRPASAAPIKESYGNNPVDLLPWGNGQTSEEQGKFEDLEPERDRIIFLGVELTQHAKQCEEYDVL